MYKMTCLVLTSNESLIALFISGIITASVQMMLWQPYKIVKELRKPDLVQSMAPRMEAPVNSEFAMICGATGDPVPTIKWWYQGNC